MIYIEKYINENATQINPTTYFTDGHIRLRVFPEGEIDREVFTINRGFEKKYPFLALQTLIV